MIQKLLESFYVLGFFRDFVGVRGGACYPRAHARMAGFLKKVCSSRATRGLVVRPKEGQAAKWAHFADLQNSHDWDIGISGYPDAS